MLYTVYSTHCLAITMTHTMTVVPCHYNDTHNDSGVPQVDTSHDNVQMAEPPPHEYVTSKC